ncbi:hypothetical protein QFC21_002345 [Naganishia friedmannii]|uniref:Uncharacterized protein n=1 Tax=Naganishia friedmannii TaxID=89922 RepID=A0ACC2VX22_9TREE|nr:hypothetical protein QFC21_002345 [Naganishia friedmannii]
MSSAFPLSPPASHQKPGANVPTHRAHPPKQDWNLGITSIDAPRTAERKRRGRMVDYIDNLPTPPSTKSNRSQHRNNFHFHADPGLPTPSSSTHKRHASQRRPERRSSPLPESQRHGANIQNIKLLEKAESSSSEVEEDASTSVSAMSDKRWLGRRGSRRPGLTFAQQMGLIAARASEQHQSALTNVETSANASHVRDVRSDAAKSETSIENTVGVGASHNNAIELNPFLDEKDAIPTQATFASTSTKRYGSLRKSASGTLLDPVDILAPSPSSSETLKGEHSSSTHYSGTKFASTFVSAEHTVEASTRVDIEEDGSEREQEDGGEDEEDDDSPYLIEHDDDDTGRHFEVREKESHVPITNEVHDAHTDYASDQHSDSSEMTELDGDDDEEEEEEEQSETHKGLSEVDEGRSTSGHTPLEKKNHRPPSITRYLSASKSSGSLSLSSEIGKDQAESSAVSLPRSSPESSRGNNRERKSWGKPTVGDVNENPFLAPSGNASSSKSTTGDTGGSWLRTDNTRMQKREGEKPTIDYVFRGQKTTFANPYYHHDPYHPPASSLLPPEHPEFSPAPVPAPRMLFRQKDDDDDEDDVTHFGRKRRDIAPGNMQSSPTARSSARPVTQMLQRRISSQMPPIARQGSTLLERAQRVRVAQTVGRAQPKASSRVQHGEKRSMEDVLGGMDDIDNGEDELLLRDSKSTARVLFGKRQAPVAAAAPTNRPTQQTSGNLRVSANKRMKMEHVMGE